MAIDLKKLINITDSTVTAGFTGVTQAGVFLDKNPIIPFNGTSEQVIRFNDADTVGEFFGTDSLEYATAVKYFTGYTGTLSLPPFCYFARYIDVGSAPYTSSSQLDPVNNLTALQAITSGSLTVNFDGTPTTITAIDLSTITTFAEAATILETALQDDIPDATVIYNADLNIFTISNGDDSGTSTVDYCTVTPLSSAMNITQADGATLVQGSGGAVAPYTRGGTLFLSDLAVLQAITSGTLTVNFNSVPVALTSINLSTATSFSQVASIVQTKLQLQIAAGTVTYDSLTQAFTISNGDLSGTSTVSYCSNSALAAAMKVEESTGAILSQGSPALTVAQNLNNVIAITKNWTSFTNLFDLPDAPNYDYQFAFCDWVIANPGYIYMLWTTEPNLLIPNNQSNIAYAMVAQGLATLNADGSITYNATMMPNFGEVDIAAFCMGMGASVDYTQLDATINFAGKSQVGLLPLVTTNTEYDALIAKSFNFYGEFNSKASTYNFTENGTIGGPFKFVDNVYNQIWLDDAIQNEIAVLIQTIKRLPNNQSGYSLLKNTVNSVMLDALDNGVAETGNQFDATQRAALIQQAGYDITPQLTNTGYVIQVTPATPAERVQRAPVKGKVWYSNGGAINTIDFVVTFVQ